MIFLPGGKRLEVDGAASCGDVIAQIAGCPSLRQAKDDFLGAQACVRDRVQGVHVAQGELARVPLAGGGVAALGSADATTCLLAAALDAAAGLAAVAHYDEDTVSDPRSVAALVEGMQRPALFVVGAARCGGGPGAAAAEATLRALLVWLDRDSIAVDLRLFCVLDWNTDARGRPRAQGLALALPSGAPLLPAASGGWRDRGPMVDARMAQLWCGPGPSEPLTSVFDGAAGTWVVTAAAGRGVASPGRRRRLQTLSDLSDAELLQQCSTSPECELPHVAGDIRAALRWVLAQEGPLRLEQRRFRWDRDRGWVFLHDGG